MEINEEVKLVFPKEVEEVFSKLTDEEKDNIIAASYVGGITSWLGMVDDDNTATDVTDSIVKTAIETMLRLEGEKGVDDLLEAINDPETTEMAKELKENLKKLFED